MQSLWWHTACTPVSELTLLCRIFGSAGASMQFMSLHFAWKDISPKVLPRRDRVPCLSASLACIYKTFVQLRPGCGASIFIHLSEIANLGKNINSQTAVLWSTTSSVWLSYIFDYTIIYVYISQNIIARIFAKIYETFIIAYRLMFGFFIAWKVIYYVTIFTIIYINNLLDQHEE